MWKDGSWAQMPHSRCTCRTPFEFSDVLEFAAVSEELAIELQIPAGRSAGRRPLLAVFTIPRELGFEAYSSNSIHKGKLIPMNPTRRTVLSYLAAFGSAAGLPSFRALLAEAVKSDVSGRLKASAGPQLYVAKDGDDRNPGTKDRPLATLARAQELVRGMAKNKVAGITVWVRKGTYYQRKPLVFEAADSGTSNCPVTYSAFPGEEVTLSGGRRLDCHWTPYKDGIMMCSLPEMKGSTMPFTQLFVNGKRQIRARYPNYDAKNPLVWGDGYIDVAQAPEPWPPTQFHFEPATFTKKRWAKPELAVVQIFPVAYWGSLQWQVKDIDWDAHQVKLGWGGFQINELEWGSTSTGLGRSKFYAAEDGAEAPYKARFYIENVFEELDSPGEWYLDSEKGILYYMPAAGVDLNHAKIEAPVLDQVAEFRGSQQDPVHHISLSGFRIAHTASTFFKQYEAPSRGDWTIHCGGAVFMEGAEDCGVEKCFFDAVGGNAIFLNNYNRHNRIYGNKITETGDSGICLVGFEPMAQGTNHPVPTENLISNNLIHDCGVFGKQIAGIFSSITLRSTISHNLVYNMPQAAMTFNDGWGGGHIIEFNEIHDTVLETSDHGPISSWGRGRYWCYEQNHGPFSHGSGYHENEKDFVFSNPEEDGFISEFRNNYLHEEAFIHQVSPLRQMGIDFDDGSSHFHVHDNLCVGLNLTLSCGDYRTVENNIFIHPSNPVMFWGSYEHNHDRFTRNIVVSGKDAANKPADSCRVWNGALQGPFVEEMDYNLFFLEAGPFSAEYAPRDGKPAHLSLEQWQAMGYDRHSICADPMFVDPEQRDYRVKSGSPALQLGFKNFDLKGVGLLPDFPRSYLG